MAHKKAGGSTKNLTDSNAKYLGVKLFAGQTAKPGDVIVR
ncbi:MAG: 50S ribosomal protein L27, partial [Patescibacteria group bacterium]|nr:50S ribosomal protein L27 [Patescibacteria group bacterium]